MTPKQLLPIILFSLSVGFLIIGIHQLITLGMLKAYWLFMISVALLMGYSLTKSRQENNE